MRRQTSSESFDGRRTVGSLTTVRRCVWEGLTVAVIGRSRGTRGIPSFRREPIVVFVVEIDFVCPPFATCARGGKGCVIGCVDGSLVAVVSPSERCDVRDGRWGREDAAFERRIELVFGGSLGWGRVRLGEGTLGAEGHGRGREGLGRVRKANARRGGGVQAAARQARSNRWVGVRCERVMQEAADVQEDRWSG